VTVRWPGVSPKRAHSRVLRRLALVRIARS
jgi:hypothetical protein